jgi:hypothetical protein
VGRALSAAGARALSPRVRPLSSSLSGSNGDASPFDRIARYKARVSGRSYLDISSSEEFSAKFVDAKNQRYLPPASHAGEVASARPSVICVTRPPSTSYTKIARNSDLSRFG